MLVDDVDRHLQAAGSLAGATVVPAMYLAWCGNLHLLSTEFQEAHAGLLTRLRLRDLSPAEFFTGTTGGAIHTDMLSSEGRAFTEHYYPDYLADFQAAFGGGADNDFHVYAVKDDWASYERIATLLTRRFMTFRQGGRRALRKARAGRGRRWWQVWRR